MQLCRCPMSQEMHIRHQIMIICENFHFGALSAPYWIVSNSLEQLEVDFVGLLYAYTHRRGLFPY